MLLLSNFLVADFLRSPDVCFASLFWFVSQYAQGCFVILLVIAIILFVGIAIIFVRLSRSVTVETCQRVTASRMVYYLALAVLSNVSSPPLSPSLDATARQLTEGSTLSGVDGTLLLRPRLPRRCRRQ